MNDKSKVGLSLAVELLRQHEGKVGKPQKWWSWELRNEFRRSLKVVLDAVEADLLGRVKCSECKGSGRTAKFHNPFAFDPPRDNEPCPSCRGSGTEGET